jgi:predicted NAD/FAD-dependent oxidoreductase
MAEGAVAELAVIGAGVGGCALAAQLRRLGWNGSVHLLEAGRGPGGRAATRRSRHDAGLRINHGAPLFNCTGSTPPALLQPLQEGGWLEPWSGTICCLDGEGHIGTAIGDGFSDGSLYRGHGGMEQLCRGLLQIATEATLHSGALVRQLQPLPGGGWRLLGNNDELLLECHWLVLSGTLLAHPRGPALFGWPEVPLQAAAAQASDPQLQRACAALAAIDSQASSNLLLTLPAESAGPWRAQPFQLLQCNPAAQARWGLRRVSIQPLEDGRCAVVAESSTSFAAEAQGIYGSRSSAAQLLGAHANPQAEDAVMDTLEQALQAALGLPTAGADRQLMRWGAAFPQPPGLPPELSLCAASQIGFCGDAIAGPGFGRVEGALRSAEALAGQLLLHLGSELS